MEIDDSLFGVDYSSKGELTSTGDIALVEGLPNAKQSIVNNILIEKGTYPSIDSEYGSEIYEVLGEDYEAGNVETVQVYIRNCLLENERVQIINNITPYTTVDKRLILNISVELVNGQDTEFLIDLEG